MFKSDQPITSHKEDILNRHSFSQSLGKAILSYKDKNSVVIGLFGAWGSGKTSIVNMSLEYVAHASNSLPMGERPIVLRFNPWNFSDQNQLISQFFKQLSSVLKHKDLGGIHFTGSNATFNTLWKQVAENLTLYRSYPRIVGETGGKDFIFAHRSADPLELAAAIARGAFEYQGQKCSAASRAYIPQSLWESVKNHLLHLLSETRTGSERDFRNAVNAVIDEPSYDRIMSYIDFARTSASCEIITGGKGDKSEGYFIEPTVIVVTDPHFRTMEEEIFGPVMSVFIYEDDKYAETLRLCDETSPYGLTGSIFSNDKYAMIQACRALRYAAGNFYINDKPSGALVGQQPFGGSRASGTNDKAGSYLNLTRWVSPRTIKETLIPATDFKYPFMQNTSLPHSE